MSAPDDEQTGADAWRRSTLIQTERLNLVSWREDHRQPFAGMHAERTVTLDLGGPMSRVESDAKFDRYRAAQAEHGFSRWAVENREGTFLGYSGVMLHPSRLHPLGPHAEIGGRFIRDAWGKGLATESARAALSDAFRRAALDEIFSYAGADNLRSQAVMSRLGLQRC